MTMRDERYDFYKGLLIIGIVLGHVLTALQSGEGSTFWIHQFVRTYDLPMFAFISGIFLRESCVKRSAFKNILNKVGGILLPALIWGELFALIGGRFVPDTGGLWFLFSIFISSIIVILINCLKNIALRVACFGIVIILLHTIIVDPFMTGFLLAPMVVGYYYKEIVFKIRKTLSINNQKLLLFFLTYSFILAQCFWKSDYSIWSLGCNVFKNNMYVSNSIGIMYRFVIGMLGSIVMKKLFDTILIWINADDREECKKMKKTIIQWGQSTLEIYILHAWLVSVAGAKVISVIVLKLGYNPLMVNERLLLFVIAPMVTIVVLYAMYYLSLLIKKIPLIGKIVFSVKISTN